MIKKTCTLLLLGVASGSLFANSTPNHTVIAPNCLTSQLNNVAVLAKNQQLSLISVTDSGIEQLIKTKHQSKKACGGFMDVSDAWQAEHNRKNITQNASRFLSNYSFDTLSIKGDQDDLQLHHEKEVKQLYAVVNPENMWKNLTTLSSFQDRYADSDNGVKAAEWLKKQVLSMAATYGRDDVSARFIETGSRYKQPSLVVKFGNSDKPGIVIGGHMDTLNSTWSRKPGADDDGSGTVTVLETARTIMASGMQFERPIYFVWYAAEEMGLVGSQYVVKDFKQANIPVKAVIQMDMTGYAYKNEKTMWLISDHVNKSLTQQLEKLITTYVKRPVKYTACGYACSDHASWTQGGFASAMPSESSFEDHNPYIHTSNDTMDHLSLDHMTDYVKLALAFAAELGDPVA